MLDEGSFLNRIPRRRPEAITLKFINRLERIGIVHEGYKSAFAASRAAARHFLPEGEKWWSERDSNP